MNGKFQAAVTAMPPSWRTVVTVVAVWPGKPFLANIYTHFALASKCSDNNIEFLLITQATKRQKTTRERNVLCKYFAQNTINFYGREG